MRTSLMLAVCSIGICGCAATPPHDSVDNRPRQTINADGAIDEYTAKLQQRQQSQAYQSATDRRIGALEDQIEQLRLSLAILANAQPGPSSKGSSASASRTPDGSASAHGLAAGESIELRRQTILFRIPSQFAQAQFTPSAAMRRWLLQASAHGHNIAVHGRTDAGAPDKANSQIAQQRALAARQFLLTQGIPATKIRCDFLGAGDYLVDNSTPAGQARNRRVEIEVNNVAPDVYREIAAAMPGEDHE